MYLARYQHTQYLSQLETFLRSWDFALFVKVKYCFQIFANENSYFSIKMFGGTGEKGVCTSWGVTPLLI